MDFNYLYHRQQVSLMRAEAAASGAARAAHEGLARLYESMILRGKAERRSGFAHLLACQEPG
jgi:hypothetical protein